MYIPVAAGLVWAYNNFDGIVLALVYQDPTKLWQDNVGYIAFMAAMLLPICLMVYVFIKPVWVFIQLFIYPPI